MTEYAWDDFNGATLEQAREQAWQEREHVAARQQQARDRFEERAGYGESSRPDWKPMKAQRATRSEWKALRKAVLERDGYRCVLCGDSNVTLHHIIKRRDGDDIAANLVSLCGHGTVGCHSDVEHYRNGARERLRPWIVDHREVLAYVLERKGKQWLDHHYPLTPEYAA